jgi:hypothetical protein
MATIWSQVPGTAAAQPELRACPSRAGHDAAWSTPAHLVDGSSPRAAVTADGKLVVVATAGDRLVAMRAGEAIDAPAASAPTSLAIAMRGKDAHVAWSGGDGIQIAALGGTAVRVDVVDDCAASANCPANPFVAAGAALHVGYAGDAIGTRIRTSRDGGKTFDPPVTALAGTLGTAEVGADGRLHVVSLRGGPLGAWGAADHAVEYTVSADGGRSFARASRVSGRDDMLPLAFAQPALAVDTRRGWIYIAYVRGGHDGVWDIVVAASKDKGVTWSRVSIGDGCAIHMAPSLAADPTNGVLHVAWLDSAGGGRLARALCPIGAPRCTETGTIADGFAVAITGGATALVLDDKRRAIHALFTRDGAVWTSTAKLPLR